MKHTDLLKLPDWPEIAERYARWIRLLREEVRFSLEGSEAHTRAHCARVLLHALVIGRRLGLGADKLDALGAAAAFHDCRRQDDWLDVGHGARAAEAYRAYCAAGKLKYDARSALAMAWHDRDDADGRAAIEARFPEDPAPAIRIYEVFKDADALDRYRLGESALDPRFLRTTPARELTAFAKQLAGKPVTLRMPES